MGISSLHSPEHLNVSQIGPTPSRNNDSFHLCSLLQPDYDVWILLTVVGTIFVVILASVLRIRCRPHHNRPVSRVGSLVEVARLCIREGKEQEGRSEERRCPYALEIVYI